MDKEKLIKLITEAFTSVSKEDGITLHQAMALANRLSEKEAMQARSKDIEKRWENIDPQLIGQMEEALYFFDEKSFRYYIPAYMIGAIQGNVEALIPFGKLTKMSGLSLRKTTPEKIIEKYKLNAPQAAAVAYFLKYVTETYEFFQEKTDLLAVEKWEKYLTP